MFAGWNNIVYSDSLIICVLLCAPEIRRHKLHAYPFLLLEYNILFFSDKNIECIKYIYISYIYIIYIDKLYTYN